ncbi:MAG: diaminopimelate decarboxylase [Vicinamibacterales bacterium]|nr:diaminopimelate decarboxylase [Vicinamibacterales bacterium]MDP7472017.1 diaminopimelate decarboxylase [Vicinamibacterales bacterium]MDP7670622.1 diaminopimelate decarboxylase [Vicinamibacterales bacterium]HJO39095.1 diaminopimelate decarboxylase [Vicinamibacterales bacterium]
MTETGFHDSEEGLACDGVPIARVADAEGTPIYVYAASVIRDRFRAFDDAFGAHPHAVHYALKANSTLAVLRLLQTLGAGADANSGGEIDVARRAGFLPSQIVFTGVGKRPDELAKAVSLGLKAINAESAGELARIDAIAVAEGKQANVALRVNPDIEAMSHPHISTGAHRNKFGVALGEAAAICREAAMRRGLRFAALHVHIGSQIEQVAPLRQAARAVVEVARALAADGIALDYVDMGGGVGIAYDDTGGLDLAEYASALLAEVAPSGLPLVLEPGRFVVGPAGVLLSRVVDVKTHPGGRTFVVLDAGMTECLRSALYGARHRIVPVTARVGTASGVDVVGPVCESSDSFGSDHQLPPLAVDDLVAILDTGAYGATMASNYNRRPMPAEALVDGGAWTLIRRRQTIDAMLAQES